jgi:hypothetical protein
MPFKNQYTPALDQPLGSELLTKARKVFGLGYSRFDGWTVDYEREMVLVHRGGGREMESANETYWGFMDRKGHYDFTTEELSRFALQPGKAGHDKERTQQDFWDFARGNLQDLNQVQVAITYKLLHFWGGDGRSVPDAESLSFIKEALGERGRWLLFDLEAFGGCQLTLLDGRFGNEL